MNPVALHSLDFPIWGGLVAPKGLEADVKGKLEGAFLIPQKAVMRRPDGSAYVYTIGDGKVVSKDIQIEQSQGENWLVTDGVEDGEQLIVDGIQRIAPGAPVTAQPVENANAGQGTAQGSAQ